MPSLTKEKIVNHFVKLCKRSIALPESENKLSFTPFTDIGIGLQIYGEAKEAFPVFYAQSEFVQQQGERLDQIVGPDDMTPLLFAAKQGDAKTVNPLLLHFKDPRTVNKVDKDGNTALRLACLYDIGRPIVRLLAFYKYTDLNLSNPLYAAVVRKQTDSVRYLLRAATAKGTSLDVNAGDGEEKTTALMIACGKGYSEIIELLLSYRDSQGDFKCDVNIRNRQGYTALHLAAIKGQTQAVIKLLQRPDINPQLRRKGCLGLTPAEDALKHRHFKIADMIFYHPHYSIRRKIQVGLFLIGIAVLVSVWKLTDSKISHGLATGLNPIVFLLLGILVHQIIKCGTSAEYAQLVPLLPVQGNNSGLGSEIFSEDEKEIISGRAATEVTLPSQEEEKSIRKSSRNSRSKEGMENKTDKADQGTPYLGPHEVPEEEINNLEESVHSLQEREEEETGEDSQLESSPFSPQG